MMLLHYLAMAPDAFMIIGKAWVEAIFGVLEMLVAKLGVLALATLAVYQNVRTRLLTEQVAEQKERLDRQSQRINEVALAANTGVGTEGNPATVKLDQTDGAPVITKEQK